LEQPLIQYFFYNVFADPICPEATDVEVTIINTRPSVPFSVMYGSQSQPVETDTVRVMVPADNMDLSLISEFGCPIVPITDVLRFDVRTLSITDPDGPQDSLTLAYDFTGIVSEVTWTSGMDALCTSCTSVNVPSDITAMYTVEVIDDNGCVSTATIDVVGDMNPPQPPPVRDTSDFYMANIIDTEARTPNNSLFLQTVSQEIIDYDLMIFNRWGNRIATFSNLTPNDPSQGWDGRSQSGEFQPSAVYVYLLTIRKSNGTEEQSGGDILLVR